MQNKPLALTILDIASIIVLAVATYLALVFAPTEAVMGQVQRVFYFHIGTAWIGLLGFVIAAVAGIVHPLPKHSALGCFEAPLLSKQHPSSLPLCS